MEYFKHKRVNSHRAEHERMPIHFWQRGYHERIIRDAKELNGARRYILGNPAYWSRDTENL